MIFTTENTERTEYYQSFSVYSVVNLLIARSVSANRACARMTGGSVYNLAA
jgi:hypothetical protein